jgi:hypothetical protein
MPLAGVPPVADIYAIYPADRRMWLRPLVTPRATVVVGMMMMVVMKATVVMVTVSVMVPVMVTVTVRMMWAPNAVRMNGRSEDAMALAQ